MPAPIVPPAPPRFSTMIDWPSCCDSGSNTMRATMSIVEPAVNGMMARIGLRRPGLRVREARQRRRGERGADESEMPAACVTHEILPRNLPDQ